jgi:hypothetical protein
MAAPAAFPTSCTNAPRLALNAQARPSGARRPVCAVVRRITPEEGCLFCAPHRCGAWLRCAGETIRSRISGRLAGNVRNSGLMWGIDVSGRSREAPGVAYKKGVGRTLGSCSDRNAAFACGPLRRAASATARDERLASPACERRCRSAAGRQPNAYCRRIICCCQPDVRYWSTTRC